MQGSATQILWQEVGVDLDVCPFCGESWPDPFDAFFLGEARFYCQRCGGEVLEEVQDD